MGPVSSVFDFVTFALLWFAFGFTSLQKQSFFHAGWFMESMLTQVVIIHLIRTTKIPFVQSRASLPVVVMSLLIAGVALVLPYSCSAEAVQLSPPPLSFFPALLLILSCYAICVHFVKKTYIHRFSEWI